MAEYYQESETDDDATSQSRRDTVTTSWDPTNVGSDISILLKYRHALHHQNEIFEEQVRIYVQKVDGNEDVVPTSASTDWESGNRGSISPLTQCILKEESLHLIVLLGAINVGKSTFLSLFLRDLWGEITMEKRTCAVVAYSYHICPKVVVRDFRDSSGNQLQTPLVTSTEFTDVVALKKYLFEVSCAPTTTVERLVEVFYPIEALKGAITLVDCPGFDENSTVGTSIGYILAEHKTRGDAAATASIIYMCNPDRSSFRSTDASFVTSM